MAWSILWTVLGVVSLILAAFTINKVESAKVGKYSSRLIAIIFAILAYYRATSIVDSIPISILKSILKPNPVKFPINYVMPALGAVGLIYYGWQFCVNWKDEAGSVLKSGWKLILIVGCALVARFFSLYELA